MKFEPLKERDPPPNYKVVVKKLELSHQELVQMPLASDLFRRLVKNGFNLSKGYEMHEDLKKGSMIYEQKKYIVPKKKKI